MKKEYIKPVATITDIKYESNLMAGSGDGEIGDPEKHETPDIDLTGTDPFAGARGSNLWDDWD